MSLNTAIHLLEGSTLATRLEKLRHSPDGHTGSVAEKMRQVISASLRAYDKGPNTIGAQREIICDYINSMPLAATKNRREVIGLADGLHDWYGADFATVNRLLSRNKTGNAARGTGCPRLVLSSGAFATPGIACANPATPCRGSCVRT